MRQWTDFPLPDGSYSDDTRPWSQQDVCNYLPTFAEASGTRSRVLYKCAPGLNTFANIGTGPHRGSHDVEGRLFIVSGGTLYQLAVDGTATSRGSIPGTGFVSMTHNQVDGGNQLVIGTGNNSYVYDTTTSTLTALGISLLSVDFLNQRILGVDVARRFWRYSGLADATSWNTLDNESAESSPDRIVGGIVSQGEWLVFGERTIEVWQNAPTQDTAFQRGSVIERGCRNANTIKRLDNTVFFVDNNGIPCRLNGYQAVPIASKAIIQLIADCDPDKLFAFTWEDKGYAVYYVTGKDGKTLGYDVTSGKWHRRQSFGLDRWRLNTLAKWNGDWYGGDYASGKLYTLTWGYAYEGCELMPRTIRSGVLHSSGNRVRIHGLRVLADTGQSPSVLGSDVAPSITGALPDALVGAVVSYQYTITRAFPGQDVTLTLDGSLPTGLSLDANGLVTGTVTTGGTFTWTITPSTDCATGTTLSDSAVVSGFDPNIETSKYLLIAFADVTDRSATSFDDSTWANGLMPLGSTPTNAGAAADGFPSATQTSWPLDKNAWFRATFQVATPQDRTLSIYLDDAAQVWINGVSVFNHTTDDLGGTTYLWSATITADKFVAGTNYIAVKCRGDIHGVTNYVSYRLT